MPISSCSDWEGGMTKASPKWTEWGQNWAEAGLYTLHFMAALVPTPVHSPDRSDMTDGLWQCLPRSSSLAQIRASGSHCQSPECTSGHTHLWHPVTWQWGLLAPLWAFSTQCQAWILLGRPSWPLRACCSCLREGFSEVWHAINTLHDAANLESGLFLLQDPLNEHQ